MHAQGRGKFITMDQEKKKKGPPKAILAVTETKGCDKRISKTRVNYKNITPLIQF